MCEGSPHVLVTGSHRSGTTWVGRTICRDTSMRYVGEPFNIGTRDVHTPRGLAFHFTHYDSSPRQREIREAMDLLLCGGRLRYLRGAIRRNGWRPRAQARQAREWLREGMPRPRALIKDPIALLSAGWLYETYGLKVICMIRGPLAFVGSLKRAGWDFEYFNFRRQTRLMDGPFAPYREEIEALEAGTGDFIDRTALLWNLLHVAILDYRRRYPEWQFVRHEDLSREPLVGFGELFDYLELELTPAIARYIQAYTTSRNPAEASDNEYQPRDSKAVLHTWKSRLTLEEAERVLSATSEVRDQFYPPGEGAGLVARPQDRVPQHTRKGADA